MTSPIPVAREIFGTSSVNRGLQGMISPVPEIVNAMDRGPASKPSVNTQPFNNERLAKQNQLQRISEAAPQAAVNAMGQVRSQTAAESDAQNFLLRRNAEAIYANLEAQGQPSAMMKINSIMQSPEKAKFMYGVATGKAMADGMSPDLGQEVAQKNMYG